MLALIIREYAHGSLITVIFFMVISRLEEQFSVEITEIISICHHLCLLSVDDL